MSTPIFWWSLAAMLVLLELTTGTVYLLMVAVGFAAGAIAAHLGLGESLQLLIAALVCGAATLGWHMLRARRGEPAPEADKSMQMDIGETLEVRSWDANGTARVMYRGAEWTVQSSESASETESLRAPLPTGPHQIVGVRGNTLIVSPRKSCLSATAPSERKATI